MWYNITMKTYCYENRYCPNAYSNEAFTIWGGGLSAWVLACFNSANNCIDWIFTDLVKFIRYPELVSGFCDVKNWRIIYE